MSYWDTSALVKLYAKEADSGAFEAHALNDPGQNTTSRVALYEARAPFRRKEAEGAILAGTAQRLYEELLQDVAMGEIRFPRLNSRPRFRVAQLFLTGAHEAPRGRRRPSPARTPGLWLRRRRRSTSRGSVL